MSGWRSVAYAIARPLLFRFDPERIHRLTVDALRFSGANPAGRAVLGLAGGVDRRPRPWVELMGIRFRNRAGVGAGFDKDGIALRGWAALGLGFAEVGTVTPLPQAGNPGPRLFRLAHDDALVNRMGFNNAGAAVLARNVMLARRHLPRGFAVGVNIGRGRETAAESAIDDYVAAHRLVAPVADYLVVNVSSPNTPGLRDLQDAEWLVALLLALRNGAARQPAPPIVVKLAPELDPGTMAELCGTLAEHGVSGVVIGNTTTRREGLASPQAGEAGGLSGAPLLGRTLASIAGVRDAIGDGLAIIASGGIASEGDVDAAYAAGADLVQLWTGLVYRGPGLIGEAAGVPFRGVSRSTSERANLVSGGSG